MNWEEKRINVNGQYLSNLRFADDLVLFAETKEELKDMLQELHQNSVKAGLEINVQKTKILANRKYNEPIKINGKVIEKVDNVKYLGQTISFENRGEKEMSKRTKKGWNKYWSLKSIFKNKLKNRLKSKVFNMCIIPTITYGSQTWAMRKKDLDKLQITQNKMERSMLNVKQNSRTRIEKIKNTLKENKNIVEESLNRKWDWAGNLARRGGNNWVEKTPFWYLQYGPTVSRESLNTKCSTKWPVVGQNGRG